MSDYVTGALITGAFALALWLLGRVSGGARKDKVETDASVAAQWQAWSQEQGDRIEKLEIRVGDLEKALEEERAALKTEREANALLMVTNQRQASLLTSLLRWALVLRNEIDRLHGDVPPMPPDVEAAMTTLTP